MADSLSVLMLLGTVAVALVAEIATFAFARRIAASRRIHAHAAAAAVALGTVIGIYLGAFRAAEIKFLPAGVLMSLCNAYVFFHFDNMGETGRRIRILRELRSSATGLSRGQILAAYPPAEVFARRVQRLLESGQCREEGGRLRLGGGTYSIAEKLLTLCGRAIYASRRHGR